MQEKVVLAPSCIYVTRQSARLNALRKKGRGAFTENRRWSSGLSLFKKATKEGQRVPVIFGAAERNKGLVFFALLTDIRIHGKYTTYSFERLTPICASPRPKRKSLVRLRSRMSLNENYIRSYVPCITPTFLYSNIGISPDLAASLTEEEAEMEFFEGGAAEQRLTNYYERDSGLRESAIRIHGTKCKACDFDFAKRFGEHGEGYTEVHHLKPRSKTTSRTKVDPARDMTVLCADCHRMVHRKPDRPLTVEALRRIIEKQVRS